MELQLSDDLATVAATTARFLENEASPALLRQWARGVAAPDAVWQRGAELGWTGLLVDERHGGGSVSGRGLKDLALVAHVFGRYAAPWPLASASVVAGALSRAGDQRWSDHIAGLLAGTAQIGWAHLDRRSGTGPFDAVSARVVRGAEGYRLSGVKAAVEGTEASAHLVTALVDGGGLAQLLVPSGTAGVSVRPARSIDLTRRFVALELDDVAVDDSWFLGPPGGAGAGAGADVELQLLQMLAVQLAESVGAMERAFELTVAWAFDRYSFGRPIASYQALKHRFADMKLWLETSHGLADEAADAAADARPYAGELVSAAKAYVGERGPQLVHECVQLHGGIGLTYEHDLHLYVRRVALNSVLLGGVRDHRLRVARMLGGGRPEAAT